MDTAPGEMASPCRSVVNPLFTLSAHAALRATLSIKIEQVRKPGGEADPLKLDAN